MEFLLHNLLSWLNNWTTYKFARLECNKYWKSAKQLQILAPFSAGELALTLFGEKLRPREPLAIAEPGERGGCYFTSGDARAYLFIHLFKSIDNFRYIKIQHGSGLRGQKQRKLNVSVYLFLLFVSSKPHYQAEF